MKPAFLCCWLLCGATVLHADEPEIVPAAKLFERFSREDFVAFPKSDIPVASSGPMVPLDGDREIHCSILEYQAQLVAAGGRSSFEVVFKHLDNKKLYMRWIAVVSLNRITGKKPLWYLFAKPGQTWNGDSDWADRAKGEWRKWEKAQQVVGGKRGGG